LTLRILEGSTFCICDDLGDFVDATHGFFSRDTRFLSCLNLTLNGKRPLLLTSNNVDYFSAAFYMRNPLAGGLAQDVLSIERRRFVGEGIQDFVVLQNQGMEPISFTFALEVGSDFADIMAVKAHDFSLGDPVSAPPLPERVPPRFEAEANQFLLVDVEGDDPARTQVALSRPGDVDGSGVSFAIDLQPHERWELQIDVFGALDGDEVAARTSDRHFGAELAHVRDSLVAWQLRVPQLRATWDDLEHSFSQSVADLASLRMRTRAASGVGQLPAAGCPWFMTVFGRDTLITCLQTLLFGPELARSALEVLADLQATEDDGTIDAEPGKIIHEVRNGKAAQHWFGRYYGTVDATPLYLVLLSEVYRWTGDAAFVRRLKEPALRALEWIDRYGDRDGDGFVEYLRRSPHGIRNQSWKDSDDSQRFRDGTLAEAPIAACEVQGYVYDAKTRLAELAREVWREPELAARLEREAEELRARFDEAFWIDDRGGYYALALDADKRQVDALGSNIGHLLWSGIVRPERADAVVDRLMGDDLWSGWGVRTMSSADAAYNPLAYHNGTVWPHDNSLIAAGLARYERWPEAHRIVNRMLTAARHFGYQLPEVFAGMRRSETPFPIAYPTAARPQAWAAGTPVLLLQTLLAVRPNRARHALEVGAPPELPAWAGTIRLSGVRAFDQLWDVRLENGRVSVAAA
jgi:glycogen debranching enzyme